MRKSIILHLALDFHYTSVWVLETLDGQWYTDYIRRKFESIRQKIRRFALRKCTIGRCVEINWGRKPNCVKFNFGQMASGPRPGLG